MGVLFLKLPNGHYLMGNPKTKLTSDEYAMIRDICDAMDPREVILSITKECPYDPQNKSCPIKEIEEWRKMGFKEAYSKVNNMPIDTLRDLVEKHCLCSSLLSSKSKKE